MSEKRLGWLKGAGTQYSMNLLKTEDNDRTHKNDVLPYLDMRSMLLPGQMNDRSSSSHLFCNLVDSMLFQTLSNLREEKSLSLITDRLFP